jgi:hypothetical protein
VKACSRPRTLILEAAKAEVVRKSPAARRAGSIPAPGTTTGPSRDGRAFFCAYSAWGGIENRPAGRATTHFYQFVLSLGYTLGYTKPTSANRKKESSNHRHSGCLRRLSSFRHSAPGRKAISSRRAVAIAALWPKWNSGDPSQTTASQRGTKPLTR